MRDLVGEVMRPTKEALEIVWERDGGMCAYCRLPITGERGMDWSLHHRRPSGMGGDPRPETHGPANLVLLTGSGTTLCHGRVESNRTDAKARGYLIPKLSPHPPSSFAIEHAVHGYVYLLADGSVRQVPSLWTEGR